MQSKLCLQVDQFLLGSFATLCVSYDMTNKMLHIGVLFLVMFNTLYMVVWF